MELTQKQRDIVEAQEPYIIVQSAAGSGKTRCLVERIKYLLEHGYKGEDIVAITFTNAAAEEIMERIGRPQGLFVGTIHSLAARFLRAYGVDISDTIEQEKFDHLFELVKKHPGCIQPVKYMLIDETQDSPPNQFDFMLGMIQPEKWMLFFDGRQCIYRFNEADPEYIFSIMEEPGVTTYQLNENFRCGSMILDFARRIIRRMGYKYTDNSIAKVPFTGQVQETMMNISEISNYIELYHEKGYKYGDWFVLCRSNELVQAVLEILQKKNIPTDSFRRADMDRAEFLERMKKDTVKVLTVHQAKGLENRCVIMIGAQYYSEEEKCISYVAATRAKELLVWVRSKPKKKKVKMVNWG
jgi:DNA helicase-2/ATP-dependent DNA helicase PcrA